MSRGKYSPNLPKLDGPFIYNCYGQLPPENFTKDTYDETIHFANYDSEGFDSYGYSAFDSNGEFVGIGDGVDRNGITENEYLMMCDTEFEQYL